MKRPMSWLAALIVVVASSVFTIVSSVTVSASLPPAVKRQSLPGVVHLSTSWSLRDSLTTGSATIGPFTDGTKPLVPVMGDWDGNGSKTPGTYEAGVWHLHNSNTTGPDDMMITFGDPKGFPVVGDFDGNGTDDLAVVRNGVWTIHYLGAGAPVDATFSFGSSANWPVVVPVAGHWTGNKADGIGTYNLSGGGTIGEWNLRNTATAGAPDTTFVYNPGTNPYPVVGDWTASGTDTVGVKAGTTWNLRNSNTAGAPDIAFDFGLSNDFPVVWTKPDASISVVKTDSPGDTVTVKPGDTITYNLAVQNAAAGASGPVTVTDVVPTGTSYVGGTATCAGLTPATTPSCTITPGATITWVISSVPALTTYNLTFQATVTAGDGATISNHATFTNVNTPGCSTATCDTTTITNPVHTPATISVVKTDMPGDTMTVMPSDVITYNLAVQNGGGTATIGAVTVTDTVPTGTTLVGGSATCGGLTAVTTPSCTITSGATISWAISQVPAMTTYNLTFQATVTAGNGATISNHGTFTNVNTPGCGAAATCDTTTITNPVHTPASVNVTKSETPPAGTVTAGQATPITYNLAVQNTGGTVSGQVVVTDAIPTNTTYVASSATCDTLGPATTPSCTITPPGSGVTWTISSIPALTTYNLTFQVKVALTAPEGTPLSNQASFTNINTPGCGTATCNSNAVTNPVVIPPPVVVAQSFSGAVGNTTFGVGTAPGQPSVIIASPPNLLTGDSDPTGHTLTVTTGTVATTNGGSVTTNGDGTFTYRPPAGFTGDDTFTYTVSNGFHSASNTATITVAGMVWYVNSALPGNGTGTSQSPFNVLSSVEPVAGTGDYIFLNGQLSPPNYTGGITLKAGQTLLSTSVGLVIGGHTIYTAGGPNPTITNTAPNPGITLAEGNTVSGIAVNATSGPGVLANGKNATTITSSSITSSGGNGLDVTGGNGTFSVGASITTSGAGHSVSVAGRTGGTVTLSGAVNDTGTGLVLASNTFATINLTGGVTASTGANTAFSATGGGTFSVTGANNTLTTTTGTALNVANTTISASGLTFKSITAGTGASGPASGIILNNTGALGGLTVTGTPSTANSGGTIQHTSGAGIQLTSTDSPSFAWMNIHDTGGSGVRAGSGNGAGDTPGGVHNFSFTNGTINNSDTAGTTNGDSNIGFNTTGLGTEQNLTGVVTITGNTLSNAFYHGVDIENYAGMITNLTISNNTITSSTSTATSKGSGILVTAFGGPSAVASITKATIDTNMINNFPSAPALQVQGGDANAAGPATGTVGIANNVTNVVAITNNTIAGASSANRIGAEGIIALVNGKGQGNFNISGNNVSNTTGIGISSSAFGFANVTETINNNTIATHNSFGAQGIGGGTGLTFTSADTPSMTTTITNNNISANDGNGILEVARDATGTLKAKIQNNTVAAPLTGVRQGIRVDSGNTNSANETVCLNISGNTSAGSTGPAMGIGLRKQGTVSTTNAFGVNGMAATATPGVETYVNGLNPAGGGTLLISATSGFSNCSLP